MKIECKRFWCPLGSVLRLDGDGFIYDPEAEYGHAANPGLRSLVNWEEIPCLVLLGEPGMGKSTELVAEHERIQAAADPSATDVLTFNLNTYSSDSLLCSDIFESQKFKAWISSDRTLYLFLDSLDEGRLEVPKIANLLAARFRALEQHKNRLRLRIACRTAEWPTTLGAALSEIWKPHESGTYQMHVLELTPLRRADVERAALSNGVDSEAFIAQVLERGILSFVTNPITLNLMLSIFKRTGGLPSSRQEIYEIGCQHLCEEPSPSRRDSQQLGILSPTQRLEIAARIAACAIFTGRSTIHLTAPMHLPLDSLSIGEVAGGRETSHDVPFEVSEATVRETLQSALFTGRGEGVLGFAHQTYAEYLAARYVATHCSDLRQLESLIFHELSANKVVPQLAETAAWLCARRKELLPKLLIGSSDIALRSDVLGMDDSTREALCKSILDAVRTEELRVSRFDLRDHLKKLRHPGIEDLLRPIILDSTASFDLRDLAIGIVESAQTTELIDALLMVAEREAESDHIRSAAILAVGNIGSREQCEPLIPYATGKAGPDSYDRVKGSALTVVWPHRLISAEELFANLIVPQRESYLGVYRMFFIRTLAEHLRPVDLPVGLEWSRRVAPHSDRNRTFHDAIEMIVDRSIDRLHLPEIRERFSAYIVSRLPRYQRICTDALFARIDSAMRMLIVADVLAQMVVASFHDAAKLMYTKPPLVGTIDLDQILVLAINEKDVGMKTKWAHLARCMLSPSTADCILRACELDSVIAEVFTEDFSAVELTSSIADRMRKSYEDRLELDKQLRESQEVERLDPPPRVRVLQCLEEFESGNTSSWIQLNLELQLNETDSHYSNDLEDDLTQLPGWEAADEETRERIVAAAESYLTSWHPDGWSWIGTDHFTYADAAGYRALVLLSNVRSTAIQGLTPEQWQERAPVILGYPMSSGLICQGEQRQKELTAQAYQYAPDNVLNALLMLVKKENSDESSKQLCSLRRIDLCWDAWLCDRLLKEAKGGSLRPVLWGDLIKTLLHHGHAPTQEYAEQVCLCREDERSREYAEQAAIALWCAAPRKGWSVLWPEFMADDVFFQNVMDVVAQDAMISRSPMDDLSEAQLADLYFHLERIYPLLKDPDRDGAHFMGPRDLAKEYRDQVLRELRARGTPSAVAAIESLVPRMPHLKFMSRVLIDARQHMLVSTWQPLTVQVLRQLTQVRSSRLVRNEEELQLVILESLVRLQQKLHGETPSVRDLWDYNRKEKSWEPIDENGVSDYVARHLKDDLERCGIVSLREVEIRRGDAGPGERTDIYVAATLEGSHTPVHVIVEVKGCWHAELQTAMESQLRDRYLKDNSCTRGIYLVAWFRCDQWKLADDRNRKTPNWTCDEARTRLDEQSRSVSRPDVQLRAFVLNASLK